MTEFFESLKFLDGDWTVVVRMCLAVLCGGLIGLEREHKHRVAGFRTHILVCIGAALTTMTSQYFWTYFNPDWIYAAENVSDMIPEGQWILDPARLGAQVVAGIGFIGAGTIIVTKRKEVKGLTTAAGLWTTAIVGLAIGVGFYLAALYVTLVILLVELLFSRLEYAIAAKTRDMTLYVEFGDAQNISLITDHLRMHRVRVLDVELARRKDEEGNSMTSALLTVRFPKKVSHDAVISELSKLRNVYSVLEL